MDTENRRESGSPVLMTVKPTPAVKLLTPTRDRGTFERENIVPAMCINVKLNLFSSKTFDVFMNILFHKINLIQ